MLLIFGLLFLPTVLGESPCRNHHWQGSRPWMSTKTGYTQIAKILPAASEIKGSQCEPLHLWTVVRHGTRYPSVKAINLMTNTLPGLRDKIVAAGKLCHQELRLLQDWKVFLDESLEKKLHEEGEREMMLLGHRLRQRLPDLLQQYEETKFNMRTTRTQRCVASGHSFVTGVWPAVPKAHIAWEEPIADHDPVIRSGMKYSHLIFVSAIWYILVQFLGQI